MISISATESGQISPGRPQIRPEIVFGPPVLSRGTTVYYVKDRFTSWFYRIGAREYFLLSRMDGRRTLQQISAEYEAQFGRHLNERSWQGLFKLLESRQLLIGSPLTNLEALKRAAMQRRRAANRGPFRWRFSLVNPDSFLEKLLPRMRFAFQPAFVFLALAAIVGLEIFVLGHSRAIVADVLASRSNSAIVPITVLFVIISVLFSACHEMAHGLTCKCFGGSVAEMGIVWRYLSFFLYCAIDDIVLFHNRWHRVYTASAGTLANLILLVPFGFCWAFAPEQSILRDLSALVLLVLNIQAFTNLVPFIELDGYFMLSHALDMIDLRKEAHFFWRRGLQKMLLKKGPGTSDYVQRGKNIYFIYGLCSLLFTGLFVAGMGYFWFVSLRQWLGNAVALSGLLLVIALAIFLKFKRHTPAEKQY